MSTKPAPDPRNGWTIYDHIEEYRGKVALKERDHKAYYESSQVDRRHNDDEIASLRNESKHKRVTLAQKTFEGDERVITKALSNDKEEQLALQRKTASIAIAEMDQKAREKAKQLNAVRYQKEQKLDRIKQMERILERMDMIAVKGDAKFAKYDMQTIRMIENNMDKAKIKYDTALKIQSTYEDIVNCMEDERLSLPKKLKALERSLEEQRHELAELKEINKDAHEKRDIAKAELGQLEQSMIFEKRSRERNLTRMKKQAEKQKEMAEKIEKRARATLQIDDALSDRERQALIDEEIWIKVTTYEEAFRRIKDATGVSDINEIESRFLNQGNTYNVLEKQKIAVEKQRKWLLDQRRQLQQQYEAMKYSGESKMSQGQQLLETMQEHLSKEQTRREKQTADLERSYRLHTDVVSGIQHVNDILKDIKVKPPFRSTSNNPDDVVEKLATCENKLMRLMDYAKIKDSASYAKILNSPEFQEFMENRLSGENLRVRLDEPDAYDSDDFGYDSQDNEDMQTASDIKRQGQNLMDSRKTKKRGRKKKN
ncbi:outer dynein arm-docking complex subunit 3-like [Amphiura filiformis]|uniref:outer dynein arm-docking complex subunit 3-like n=1 Tax=Amphiura filiformis TaxID=82378 RepID=UPI003B221C43